MNWVVAFSDPLPQLPDINELRRQHLFLGLVHNNNKKRGGCLNPERSELPLIGYAFRNQNACVTSGNKEMSRPDLDNALLRGWKM